ncbi:MAG: MutS-related protein [Chitinophagaceae bacterium]
MRTDATTLQDISVFQPDENDSLFHRLDFTITHGGREELRRLFKQPHSSIEAIIETQTLLKSLATQLEKWPKEITNGTLLVTEKFLDYPLDPIDPQRFSLNNIFYRWLHSGDYAMLRFSMNHLADLCRGLLHIHQLANPLQENKGLQQLHRRLHYLLDKQPIRELAKREKKKKFSEGELLCFGRELRGPHKNDLLELIQIYYRFDAWYSMAKAMSNFHLQLPEFIESASPLLDAKGLYHLMVPYPVSYNARLNEQEHFMFLTGANMAGKSTLIKAIGAAVYLAHLGMGVPALTMRLSLFDGIISNGQVADNIARGESYFFNEVQRIRHTIETILDQKKWLVLMDEIFKGTNVQDAMKCSTTVIEGLLKQRNSLFILSTHLYEMADSLKEKKGISFRYFETAIQQGELKFSYQLKEGVSNDRIGYLILTREKVVELLEKY